ncbi:hypothetical protein C1646_820233 [Rhizophagus diaphanus]|nr:hypothetical protein C1646_820233 [Rhizophagus diaphanus] [Rhizophagus sp. MUCL 43196]
MIVFTGDGFYQKKNMDLLLCQEALPLSGLFVSDRITFGLLIYVVLANGMHFAGLHIC